jgi:hypothetical protein
MQKRGEEEEGRKTTRQVRQQHRRADITGGQTAGKRIEHRRQRILVEEVRQ